MGNKARGIHLKQSLVFDFDTLEQKNSLSRYLPENTRFFDQPENELPADTTSFAGILRASDLLSRNILLLDVQLLDGVLFLDRGPGCIRSLLARESGRDMLTVLTRAPSLQESLRSLLLGTEAGAKVLTAFEFSALAMFVPGLAPETAKNLQGRSTQRLRACSTAEVARTVAAELQAASEGSDPACHVAEPTGGFADLAAAWESWFVEADEQGITVRQWSGGFNLVAALRRRPRSALPTLAAAQQDLSGIGQRSVARAYLQTLQLPGSGDAAELADWWMHSYFDALARQHGATWLRFRKDADATPPSQRFRRRKAHGGEAPAIAFQGSLVATLHDMPPQAYALLRHQAREAIRDWHANPSQKTSDNLAYAVAHANSTVSRGRVRRAMWKRVALTVVPAAAGVLAAGFFASLLAGVGTALLSIAVAVPLVDLADLHATRKKAMRAYIHFPEITA